MSDINFCNTKEQLNHLGEVVTGKVGGSPTGADIDTSTLPYTGQVRKTLPALEEEYQADIDNFVQVSDQVIVDKTAEFNASIANKESEADAAIDAYRLLSKGPYAVGILLEDKFQYITYNGESYFAVNPPYTTTATTPDTDGNLFAGGYLTSQQLSLYTGIVYKASGGNSAAENMIAGIPVVTNVGFTCQCENGTIFKRLSITGSISDFECVGSAHIDDFGAIAIDTQDNSPAITLALSVSETVVTSGGGYGFSTLTIDANKTLNLSGGYLFQIDSAITDAIFMTGDNSNIVNGEVKRNLSNPGNLDGIVISGNNCQSDVNTDGFFYSRDVSGDNCIVKGIGKNANYSPCRLNVNGTINRFTLRDFYAKDYQQKGFVFNGTGYAETVVIDNFDSSVDGVSSPADSMNGLLSDSTEPLTTYNIGTLKILNSNVKTAGSGNKFLNVRKLIVDNCDLLTENTYGPSSGLYSEAELTIISNTTLDDRISIGGDAYIGNVDFTDTFSRTDMLIQTTGRGSILTLSNIDYSSIPSTVTYAIRLQRSSQRNEQVKVGFINGDGSSEFLGVFTQPLNVTTFLELTSSQSDIGNFGAGLYTLVAHKMIDGTRRHYGVSSNPPTSGDYRVGDVVTRRFPGAYAEWICTVAGNPGTWKGYSPIEP